MGGGRGSPMAMQPYNIRFLARVNTRSHARWRHSTLSHLCVFIKCLSPAQGQQHRSVGHRLADELSVGEHAALELEAETGAGTA